MEENIIDFARENLKRLLSCSKRDGVQEKHKHSPDEALEETIHVETAEGDRSKQKIRLAILTVISLKASVI